MSTHANRVQMSVSGTPGTGTITLNAATTGYRSFASAYGGNATVDVLIVDGTSWEVARDCTYTNSGTTLTRGTLESSSTGSAISLTSSAVVSVALPASTGNAIEDVCIDGGEVYVTADGTNTQTLTLATFERMRGNADSPSNGVLRTEVRDQRGWWNAGIARFTPTVAGRYLAILGAQGDMQASTTGIVTFIPAWYRNGSVLSWGARAASAGAQNIFLGGSAVVIANMNGTTDYLEPYVFYEHGGATPSGTLRNIAHGNFVMIRYLGR